MSYGLDYYSSGVAAHAQADERATFIRRTYAHLAGAILAFVVLETVLVTWLENWLQDPANQATLGQMFASRFSWLIVLGGFMLVGWIAQSWAQSSTSPGLQYLGLGLYVVAEAVIFLPIIYVADTQFPGEHVIPTAGVMTLAVFGGLTLSVFLTRRDFSFLGPILSVASLIALGFILVACLFGGVSLGMFFSFAMVALMSGYILYYTSQVMLHYRTDQYVAASLALFAAVATLFWYILRIVMAVSSRR